MNLRLAEINLNIVPAPKRLGFNVEKKQNKNEFWLLLIFSQYCQFDDMRGRVVVEDE